MDTLFNVSSKSHREKAGRWSIVIFEVVSGGSILLLCSYTKFLADTIKT
jgi:hypothetical protein